MKERSVFRTILWGLLALVVLFHMAGGWYFSDVLKADGFVPAPEAIEEPPVDVQLDTIQYESPLGMMDAWYLPASGDLWVIHVHGKGGTPAQAEVLFAPLQEAGYPQLSITYRNDEGAPLDPSGYYRYGVTEWEDVNAAVEWARANGAEKIVLSGFSTGAAHTMSFALHRSLQDTVGFLMDAPNVDFSDTVDYGASQRELPLVPWNVPPTLSAVAKFITALRIDVSWHSIDYISKADLIIRSPVLVHHGVDDLTVPVTQSKRLQAAVPTLVTLIEVPGAGHLESSVVQPEEYVADVLSFLDDLG